MPKRTVRASSSVQTVFDQLVAGIITGRYPAGCHLPSERELSRTLQTGRTTLREAMRGLTSWRLVDVRHGSGVMVRDQAEWAFDVLPAYLRFGGISLGPRKVAAILADLLDTRRALIVDLFLLVPGRLKKGGLDAARAAVARAWQQRGDSAAFVREDLQVIRAVLLAAELLPPLWILNSITDPYLRLAEMLGGTANRSRKLHGRLSTLFRCRRERRWQEGGAFDEPLLRGARSPGARHARSDNTSDHYYKWTDHFQIASMRLS